MSIITNINPVTKAIGDRDRFSNLALNTVSVLGNIATQLKRVLPKDSSQPLALVKCLNFASAINNFDLASNDIHKANLIKDSYGAKLNEVKLARSAMQFISGILYFSSLGLNAISCIASWKVIIVTSKVFSKTTTLLSNSAAVLVLLNTCMKLYEQMGFTAELAKLQAHQELSSEQKQQAIAKFLKEQMSVSEPLQEKVKKALEEKYKGNQKKIDKIFSRAISKKIQAQTAYVKRMTNKNCVELIQKMNLTDSHAVISTAQEVQKVVRDNIKFNLLLGGLGCIGLISLAISFIPGSIFVTLSTILSLIPAAFFSISGINDLICSLQNNKEGTYDRLLLIATGCVGIVTSTILYALAENPLVKVTAALLALVWLALLYYVSLHLESHTEKAKACFV
jgi:hypothetical protein